MRLDRQITVSLVLGGAVAFATVGLLALWIVRHTDNMAAAAVQTMLAGGGRVSTEQYALRTNDYAWWGEAYRAYLRNDKAWLDVNVGTGVTETAIADVLAIYSPEGEFRHGWSAEGRDDASTILTPQVFASAVHVLDGTPLSAQGAQTLMARHGDELVLVGAARMSPGDRSGPDKSLLPVVMLGTFLTSDRVAAFGANYLVDDLKLAREPESGKESRPILDENGSPLAYLTWTPPTPGRDALLSIAMPLTAAMLLFAGTTVVILSRAQQLAEALALAARRDYLTRALNRKGLADFLLGPQGAAALSTGDIAVIYTDINGFKAVNDTVGHAGGDRVISDLADRIRAEMPPLAEVARVGGNAFLVVLTGPEANLAASLAGRLPAMIAPRSRSTASPSISPWPLDTQAANPASIRES